MTHENIDRRQRVETLLDDLLRVPQDQREQALRSWCGEDTSLREELESLIAERSGDTSFLSRRLVDARADMLEQAGSPQSAAPDLPAGSRLGAYRIVRELGRGGMGTVYLAERAEPPERTVALKVTRRGVDARHVRERFIGEMRILARLEHPHIARLYEGEATEGVPYFAMEYVDGGPLTVHCDRHRLTVKERLHLFLSACDAVRYAHQHLIVHRDLKPSNIFVSHEGVVKLLDFGIATLVRVDDDATAGGVANEDETILMTPEYATPEQVARAPVTTVTDVYALGAVLYELLSGRRAHRLLSRTPEEIRRVICEEDPPRPSATLLRDDEVNVRGTRAPLTARNASDARRTTSEALRRMLADGLDHIVVKAMRKDPRERYASVDALAEDVRRYLAGLPVHARAGTVRYRAGKFIGRHRAGVALAVAVSMLLIGSASVTAWQAREARLAAAEASRAAARAERVSELLIAAFESSDPDRAGAASAFARTVLDAGAARLDADLAGEPDLRDDIRLVVADVYKTLGLHGRARLFVERALASRRQRLGDRDTEVAQGLHARGELLYLEGRHDSAQTALSAALEIRRATLGDAHVDIALTLGHLAEAMRRAGSLDSAERLVREALAMRRRVYGPEHPQVAHALNQVGLLLREKGKTDEALPYYQQALDMLRRTRGEAHSDVLVSRNNLAGVMRTRGDLEGAERMLVDVLARYREMYDSTHQSTITAMNNLAAVYTEAGDFVRAEPLFREVLQQWRARGGDEHPLAIASQLNLAVVVLRSGKPVEAESLLRSVVRSWERDLGADHPNLAVARAGLAGALTAQGRNAWAEAELWPALKIARAKLGPGHPRTASILVSLGSALLNQGRCGEAEPMLREVMATPAPGRAEPERRVGEAHLLLGRCLTTQRRYTAAESSLVVAHGMLKTQPGRQRELDDAGRALVTLYEATGRTADAARWRATAR